MKETPTSTQKGEWVGSGMNRRGRARAAGIILRLNRCGSRHFHGCLRDRKSIGVGILEQGCDEAMSGKPGQKSTLSTEVETRFDEDFLDSMDGRVSTVRTLRQRLSQLMADLGGLAQLSYQERSLCRRVVHLERLIEKKEASLAHGGTVDENGYLGAINALSGLFTKIGLRRRPKIVGTLQELLAATKEPHAVE